MVSNEKYYKPNEIKLSSSLYWEKYFKEIIQHEIYWLLSLGCEEKDFQLTNKQHPDSPFHNRIYITQDAKIPLKYKWSLIVNPLLVNGTTIDDQRFAHKLSSIVLWQELKHLSNSDLIYSSKTIQFSDKNNFHFFHDYLKLFSSFFGKIWESQQLIEKRLQENLTKGTHIILYDKWNPTGIIWTIEYNRIASIYTFLIIPWHTTIQNHRILRYNLIKELKTKGTIDFVYLKTRNKAVDLLLRRYSEMEFLYSEHIYHET